MQKICILGKERYKNMKDIIQNSCSELLCDTSIHNVDKALDHFTKMFKKYGFTSEPELSKDMLQELKYGTLFYEMGYADYKEREDLIPEVTVYDIDGNRASLEYGSNGYLHTGFRADTNCDQSDSRCFPILNAFEKEGGEIIACDGGSTDCYDDWKQNGDKA
jgi:hypothetical protein